MLEWEKLIHQILLRYNKSIVSVLFFFLFASMILIDPYCYDMDDFLYFLLAIFLKKTYIGFDYGYFTAFLCLCFPNLSTLSHRQPWFSPSKSLSELCDFFGLLRYYELLVMQMQDMFANEVFGLPFFWWLSWPRLSDYLCIVWLGQSSTNGIVMVRILMHVPHVRTPTIDKQVIVLHVAIVSKSHAATVRQVMF